MALRSIELFAGGGGLALGLEAVGVVPVCFVEREAFAAATLVRQMEEGGLAPCPVWSDVSTFDGRPWRGVVDLVAGGFPCQDISNAGKREGIDGERSGLWAEFARIVGEVRPRLVFVENVAALAARGLNRVLGDLAALGFDAEWGCLGADDAGAPHGRERLFVLAHARCLRVVRIQPEHEPRGGSAPASCGPREGVAYAARPLVQQEPSAGVGLRPGPKGEAVAHSNGHGLGELGLSGLRINGDAIGGRDPHRRRRPWPPAPDDADGWREYLDRWPGTEPAVRRGAHGLARRVDRLRLLGNGVVPDQATLAFRILWERLHA